MRKAVLDTTGNVRTWLTCGRGAVVWTSHDIGAGRPDIYTPADHVRSGCGCAAINYAPILPGGPGAAPSCRKPHWAYVPERVMRSESDALFYLPGQVVASWSDTPAGHRAAERALSGYKDQVRSAPIGTVYTTYSLHRFAVVAAQISPEGTTLDEYAAPLAAAGTGQKFSTYTKFRVGVRLWSCVDGEGG